MGNMKKVQLLKKSLASLKSELALEAVEFGEHLGGSYDDKLNIDPFLSKGKKSILRPSLLARLNKENCRKIFFRILVRDMRINENKRNILFRKFGVD